MEQPPRGAVQARPKHRCNWPEHLCAWLAKIERDEPERLKCSCNKLAAQAQDFLQETLGWAPSDEKQVAKQIAEWMRERT